jgi:hypothetical protein
VAAPESAERTETRDMREFACVRLGMTQHRQVTAAQLRAIGFDKDTIARRVRQGRLHPVFAGVYSLGGPPQTPKERWMAAVLTFGPGALLAATAAAELYGWLRYPIGELHVLTPTRRAPRQGIRTHHRSGPVAAHRIDHIPVTGPERTILDCATTIASDKLFRRIVRQAQAERTTTHARLLLLTYQSAGARGNARLRAELAEGPSPTRSANEDRVLELLRNPGRVLSNHVIGTDEVDMYLPDRRAVIEVQSELHANPAAAKHDAEKRDRLELRGLRVFQLT